MLLGVQFFLFSIAWGQTASFREWGQSSTPASTHQIQVTPVSACLWEVSHPARQDTSYLYGILPEVPERFHHWPEKLPILFPKVQELVMGIDPMHPPSESLYQIEVPLDSTLEELLPSVAFEKLVKWVEDSLSPLANYKLKTRYPPSVLSRQFLKDYCWQQEGATVMVEYQLAKMSRLPLKKVGTEWTRIAWLDSYSYSAQATQMMNLLTYKESQCEIYESLFNAYGEQDLDRVWLLASHAPDLGYNLGKLLAARNDAWIKYLKTRLPYQSMLIAVNAAQLPGEYGMIHQLRKLGYQVEPIY